MSVDFFPGGASFFLRQRRFFARMFPVPLLSLPCACPARLSCSHTSPPMFPAILLLLLPLTCSAYRSRAPFPRLSLSYIQHAFPSHPPGRSARPQCIVCPHFGAKAEKALFRKNCLEKQPLDKTGNLCIILSYGLKYYRIVTFVIICNIFLFVL